MIFFFLPKSAETPTAIYQAMQAAADVVLNKDKKNFNPVQMNAQVPFWLKKTQSSITHFLQSYYDWLSQGYGYTGVNMMDLKNLFDISETPEFLLPHYMRMYAPDMLGIYGITSDFQPTPDRIRRTIENIRQEVYQRKSNEDAFKSLMVSLFGITGDTIRITYPKRKIMRLNAGRLEWMSNSDYYGNTGEYSSERYTMVGSNLNQGVLPDGRMWQDFSYVLTSDVDDSNPYYEAVVKETLHPAGLLGIYETTERYSEGDFSPGFITIYEVPNVSNYYPYTLGMTATLNKCSGCTGTLFKPGWTFPTFVYPSWDDEIANGPSANFGSIRISDFLQLNTIRLSDSPNNNIGTICDFPCGICGSVEYAWSVGVGEQFEGDAYTEIPIPEFFSPDDSIELEDPGTPP